MDGLMGRYHIRAKTTNVMMRIFYHLLDMAVTNSYILYRRKIALEKADSSGTDGEKEKVLELPEFREAIAEGLVTYIDKRKGRRAESRPTTPTGSSSRARHPVDDIRYDLYDHMPEWGDKKRCKHCKISQTQCSCPKCGLHLCCTSAKNCFWEYHHKE